MVKSAKDSFLDDMMPDNIRDTLNMIEQDHDVKHHCPHLRRKGRYYWFCGKGIPEDYEMDTEDGLDPVYLSNVSGFELQFWCMAGEERYTKCSFYNGKLTPKCLP